MDSDFGILLANLVHIRITQLIADQATGDTHGPRGVGHIDRRAIGIVGFDLDRGMRS